MRFKAGIPAIVRLLILGIALALVSSACRGGTETDAIEASGTIEAEEVIIASEFGGRVADVLAEEGDEVEENDVLISLDTSLVEAQMGEAEAAVAAARANLARVQGGARPGEIATAEAMLEQAIAARDGAERSWLDAQAVRDNPQQLNAQIDEARAQVELAERQVVQAEAQQRSMEIERDSYAGAGDDESKTRYEALDQQVKAAEAGVAIAEQTLEGAQAHLENLIDMRDRPIAFSTTVNKARAQYEQAQAAVEVGQASLDALLAKPTEEEVAIAQAQVSQAEAALGILQVQKDKMTLLSPLRGLVSNRAIHVGETASPGATLMTVADLDEVRLTVYIPENRYGRIQLGQPVSVEVDSFPGNVYEGRVTYISSQAEFTPRNVQTQEERVSTVFAVKILIPNPDHDLKPGMPADATIEVE